MLCCFFIKLPFKGLGATAGKVRAVAFDTVWGLPLPQVGKKRCGITTGKGKPLPYRLYIETLRINPIFRQNSTYPQHCSDRALMKVLAR